jgi:ATP-dependent Clp protease ATP-binding subunit ClpA
MVVLGKLPQTPRAKKVIEFAIEEARSLNLDYVGTEHLLLGLVRETEGVGAQVLLNLGVRLDDVRAETMRFLGQNGPQSMVIDTKIPRIHSPSQMANLTIFICGLMATLTAAWIVGSFAEDNVINAGAILGGIVYVLAVAVGYSQSRRQPGDKA